MKKAAVLLLSIVLMLSTGVADASAVSAGLSDFGEVNAAPGADSVTDTKDAEDNGDTAVISVGMSNFQRVNFYIDGQFTDVTQKDWFSANVAAVYELGLMSGSSDDFFDAAGPVTKVQSIVMAARLHSIYYTGSGEFEAGEPWYAPYVSYAIEHGIVSGDVNIYGTATRAQFADVLSHAMPAGELEPINEIVDNAIPDVKTGNQYAGSIYTLYRAGIVTGSNSRRAFYPSSTVSRAEAAAIIARMADKNLRQAFTLQYSGPDLTKLESKDDSFFANSAILGNSLVEGLRMFSNLKSLHYFSVTSVSVVSATQTKNVRLKNGSYGTLVQSLCQEQYDSWASTRSAEA